MKQVLDDIMARLQDQAASKRRLLELGKLHVDPPTETQPEQQAKLEAAVSAPRNND